MTRFQPKRPLPEWATLMEKTNRGGMPIVVVDADAAYPAVLAEYRAAAGEKAGYETAPPEEPDQYWVEVAYQTIKMDVQFAMGLFGFELRVKSPADPETGRKRWALKNFPPGPRGTNAVNIATKGREARGHYERLRGFLPTG